MRTKRTLLTGAVIAAVFALALTAQAGPRRHGAMHDGPGMGLRALEFFVELNLTEAQQTQIREIIGKYRPDIERLRADMPNCRKEAGAALKANSFDEDKARAAFKEASAAREEMMIQRAKMAAEIKSVMTAEQIEKIDQHRQERMERKQQHAQAGRGFGPGRSTE